MRKTDRARQGPPDSWRVQMNFVESKDILRRFGVWPDDVLTIARLEELYSGRGSEGVEPFARETEQGVRPLFPFLDESEGVRVAGLWETRKDVAYLHLKDGLGALSPRLSTGPAGSSAPLTGCVLLILQSLIILDLRNREMELGMWDDRTAAQKMGTLFAVKPTEAMFTRVEAIPFAENEVVCLPWGGPFGEYSKILEILEDQHTARVLASADEKMEIVPDAVVLKKMVAAGLVRETRESFMDSHWVLSIPAVGWEQVRDALPTLSRTAQDISGALAEALPQIPGLMKSGRYSYLEGPGDYTEMTYSVVMGLLLQRAMEDGLLSRPPRFRATGDGPVVERSRAERRSATWTLPGLCIIRDSGLAWERVRDRNLVHGSAHPARTPS